MSVYITLAEGQQARALRDLLVGAMSLETPGLLVILHNVEWAMEQAALRSEDDRAGAAWTTRPGHYGLHELQRAREGWRGPTLRLMGSVVATTLIAGMLTERTALQEEVAMLRSILEARAAGDAARTAGRRSTTTRAHRAPQTDEEESDL